MKRLLFALLLCWPAAAEALTITAVTPQQSATPAYGMMEIDIELGTTYENPYDPEQIAVWAEIDTPTGASKGGTENVNAFWYEPMARTLDEGREVFTSLGAGRFRLRYAPPVEGTYTVRAAAADADEQVQAAAISFTATTPESGGFVRADERNPRYFALDDGSSYAPLGFCVCWVNDPAGAYAYNEYLDALADGGGNWTRLWMSHFSEGTTLEWGADHPSGWYEGLGRYSQPVGKRLDDILQHAQDRGVYLQLVLHQHSQFASPQWSSWAENPYNAANGGPCATSLDYFTDPEAWRLADNLHRYIVARFAAYRSLLSWEIFNEAEGIVGVPAQTVNVWMRATADRLREWDPAAHPVSTSYASPVNFPSFDLAYWDFNNRHQYTFGPWLIGLQIEQFHNADRPVLLSEYGIDWWAAGNDSDPLGINIHTGIWSALMYGYAGGAMNWWWDEYIEPLDLWGLNLAPGAFLEGEELYRFTENANFGVENKVTGVQACGLIAPDAPRRRVLGWAWDPRCNWLLGETPAETISGLRIETAAGWPAAAAECEVEYWDTRLGVTVREETVTLSPPFTLTPPDFACDIAFKMDCLAAGDDDDDNDDDDNDTSPDGDDDTSPDGDDDTSPDDDDDTAPNGDDGEDDDTAPNGDDGDGDDDDGDGCGC